MSNNNKNANNAKKNKIILWRYSAYNKINYNARTYLIKIN